MNNLQIFNYKGNEIRTVEKDGITWWVLKDVCIVLDINQPIRVAERLDEDEVSQTHVIDSLGREQNTYVINESGLYNVILRSDKEEAKPFRKWVTSEVLPSIRKYGTYELKQKRRKPVDIIFKQNMNIAKNILENMEIKKEKAFIIAIERTEELTGEDLTAFKNLILTTKNRTGYLSISMLSDIMGLPIKDTNNLLENCKFQYRNEKKQWKLTEEGQKYGEEILFNRNGRNCCQIRWNERILDFIDDKIMD
jgi:prophage antirepressor-like protein